MPAVTKFQTATYATKPANARTAYYLVPFIDLQLR